MKKNKSFNQRKPKTISTDNNILICQNKKKEEINKNKININNNNKIKTKYNIINDNDNDNNHVLISKQNGSYTKLNKNKVNTTNTCENHKKNNSILIRSKTNENYNISKENKSNISNFDKRKNYNVPKIKVKQRSIEKEEKEELIGKNEEEGENEKEKNISKLLQNQEVSYIKEIKKLLEEWTQSKKIKNFEIKKRFIEENGFDFENCFEENEDEEKEEKEENDNTEIIEIEKSKTNSKKMRNIELKKKKLLETDNNENIMKKNDKINNKYKEKKIINDEQENIKTEIKNKIIKDKSKININRKKYNNDMQNITNTNNSSKNNYLMLHNENVNMNLSGSSEKNVINNDNKINNKIVNIQYCNKNNNFNYDFDEKEQMEPFIIKKEKRKQNVNTFEFYEKINNYLEIKDKNKKEYYEDNIPPNDSLGESFRKSISSSKNNNSKSNNKNNKKYSNTKIKIDKNEEEEKNSDNELISGFNYDTKKNIRSKSEILEFMEQQKKKNKFEEEKNLKNNQAKTLKNYLGLFKLQEGINLNTNKNKSKINSNGNNIKKEINDNKNNKERIPNDFYIGKKNILKRKNSDLSRSTESSQSTIIEQNNYYLDLITSKNILFNYNNQNLIDNENVVIQNNNKNNEINNNIINTDNSNNVRITTKDKDVQNTYNINTSNNKISQENINEKPKDNIKDKKNKYKLLNGDLFTKCKETLEKANQLFSKPKIEEYINNYKTSYNDKNIGEINNNYNYNDANINLNAEEFNNEDNEEGNQIINTQINKSESKTNKSINEPNNNENNNIDIQEDMTKKLDLNKNINNNYNLNNLNINNYNDNLNNYNNINNNKKNKENQINVLNNNKNEEISKLQKEDKIKENENNKYINNQNEENKTNEQKNQNINMKMNKKNNEDIKEILEKKKSYYFSQEELENYYKIFISLDDYLNSLTKKNALNDIISYGDLRYTYKIGFEHILFLLKSYPFNLLRLIYQRQYYKDVLRQFFIPYLRRAFNNIHIYTYYKVKFYEVNKIIEQIYIIIFLKRLNFYGQKKQLYKIENSIANNNIYNEEKPTSNNKNNILNNSNINNNNNENNKDKKEDNEKEKEKEKEKLQSKNKEKIMLFIKLLELLYKQQFFTKLYNYYLILDNKNKQNENDISDKSNNSSQRYNTYLYESFSEKSSLTAYPNSEGSARLHKVCELLEMQRKPQLEDENNNLSELANDSINSIKSLDNGKYKKRINFENKNIINNIKNNEIKDNLLKLNEDKENKNKQNEIKENSLNIFNINDENNKINEQKIVDEDGLNIPYEERINNLNKNKDNKDNNIKDNLNNEKENDNLNNNIKNKQIIDINIINNNEMKEEKDLDNNNENQNNKKDMIVDKKNTEIKYENLPRKIETEQYRKIEIQNDNNNNKYIGCIKKIEISNNLKINKNSLPSLEDISASKESNLIEWEFNNSKNNNQNNNNFTEKRDQYPSIFSNDLINSQKKDDLFNSLEFNSNIKEGIIEENDMNVNEENQKEKEKEKEKEKTIENNNIKIDNNNNDENINKEILEQSEKKSRNNIINDIKNDIKEINNNINDDNKNQKDLSNALMKAFEENNYQIDLNLSNSFKNKDNNLNSIQNNNIINNNNLRYNDNNGIKEENINKEKEKEKEKDIKINQNEEDKMKKIFLKLSEENIEKLNNDLCEEIISIILSSEIKDKKKSLFKKKKEINNSLNNSSASLLVSQNSMSIGSHSPGRNYPVNKNINLVNNNDSYQTISSVNNNSQTEAILNNSIFMRTIDEIKKEKTLNLYNDKIGPLLIDKIENNIEQNYENIINNLKVPLKIDEAKMINGLMLKDRSLSISSKIRFCNEDITKMKFVEENILNDFDNIDKEIRNNDNIITDNFYDKILNKCVYDTSNELIEKQRKYGIIGEPLSWSIRTKEIDYKYKNNDKYSKSIFINKIIKEMKAIINTKMGLIAENYEYLDMDQLNQDRDKKFMDSITKELKDNEEYYQIFETQETYVKLSLSRIIMDQLLNEIVEILEHVQYSRKEPDKYQSKSIYACEDIPRLSFQPQTMENNYTGNFEGDGEGDESINQ